MKKTLAYDTNARQFKTDVKGKRFYLGTDAAEAEDRKRKIVRHRATLDAWTPTTLAIAKAIAKGEKYHVPTTGDDYADEAHRMALHGRASPSNPSPRWRTTGTLRPSCCSSGSLNWKPS